MKKIILATIATTSLLTSLEAKLINEKIIIPSNGSDLKITIYNKNLAFINDKRTANVKQGYQSLVYEGIPKNIISQSVIPTFSNIRINLYSQNYMYDLISLNSMLLNSIDSEIEYYANNYINLENPILLKGTLLSPSPVMIKDSETNKIISLNNPKQVIFKTVPKTMITKPSLVWKVETEKSGELGIDLKYLSTGISWNSDYVLNLRKDSLDLNGWITITNNSGVSYDNAKITCLAGEINKVARPNKRERFLEKSMVASSMDSMKDVKEESFSGYHIYKIPFKENIKNKQKKQIVFIDKKNIEYKQYGKNINNHFDNYGKQDLVFQNIIEFSNSKENNLGIALPSGIVRMYKKDSKDETHFIGEDRFKNIPKNETVKLKIGNMFDVVGEKKITKFRATKYERNVETTYEIRNRGIDNTLVKIEERIPNYGRKIRVESSCKGQCSIKMKSALYREYLIKLEAGETYHFTSEFKVKYH